MPLAYVEQTLHGRVWSDDGSILRDSTQLCVCNDGPGYPVCTLPVLHVWPGCHAAYLNGKRITWGAPNHEPDDRNMGAYYGQRIEFAELESLMTNDT